MKIFPIHRDKGKTLCLNAANNIGNYICLDVNTPGAKILPPTP